MLVDWNHHKIPFFSAPPALHASHVPSTVRAGGTSTGEQIVAPGAETTGNAQIVNALGTPFVLEGLFGEADAEAMDAEPLGAEENAGMDVEDDDDARGGMQIDDEDDDDDEIPSSNPRKRAHSPAGLDGGESTFRAPKRLRRLVVRSASLPTAAIAVRSRRAERLARRRREKRAVVVAAGMDVDGGR